MPLPEPELGGQTTAAVHRHTVSSPVGALTLFEQGDALTALVWAAHERVCAGAPTELLVEAEAQVKAYFDGRLRVFDLPLAAAGTEFQVRVWHAVAAIPFGGTRTYGRLAEIICSGARAVGAACGTNPIPIIVPCHRLVGAGGELHGYSGRGGISTKARLLNLEGVHANV